jgi:hypothetical protein
VRGVAGYINLTCYISQQITAIVIHCFSFILIVVVKRPVSLRHLQ